jgi:low affinity Fe/Cu permease
MVNETRAGMTPPQCSGRPSLPLDSTAASATPRRDSWLQRDRIVPKTRQLPSSSRRLYLVDHYSSLPMIAPTVGLLLIGAIVLGAVLRYPSGWIAAFEVGTSFVTVMMVLVIQHTQSREQTATQRKLDELLRALPEAESRLMLLEEAPDDVMRSVEREQRESKETATDETV